MHCVALGAQSGAPQKNASVLLGTPTRLYARTLAPQHEAVRELPAFPSRALELRPFVFRLRISEAQVSDEAPLSRDVQDLAHMRGVEDRDPAHSDALCTRG